MVVWVWWLMFDDGGGGGVGLDDAFGTLWRGVTWLELKWGLHLFPRPSHIIDDNMGINAFVIVAHSIDSEKQLTNL
jgi:hypothetical protein